MKIDITLERESVVGQVGDNESAENFRAKLVDVLEQQYPDAKVYVTLGDWNDYDSDVDTDTLRDLVDRTFNGEFGSW